jgi:nitrous oxide reductase accessory protein NosL
MKFLFAALLFLLLSGCENSTIVVTGNEAQEPILFEKGKVRCSECQMVIEDYPYSAQIATPKGKTYFFSDVGSFVKWNALREFGGKEKIWVFSNDTSRWIDAKKAFYSQNDTTPMEYGFGAYEKNATGFLNYATMREKMLRGENMTNPAYKKRLLEEKDGR